MFSNGLEGDMKRKSESLVSSLVGVFVCLCTLMPNSARAQQEICGTPPSFDVRKEEADAIKGDLNGKAQALSKFLGNAELTGRIESERKTLYQTSEGSDANRKDAYLAYLFCMIIMQDKSANMNDKLKALQTFRQPIPISGEGPKPRSDRETEFYTKVSDTLSSRANTCSLGQPVNTSGTKFMDVCLCLGEYDKAQRTLSYQIKIKGKNSNRDEYQGLTRWITYEYNTSASFNSPVKTDESLTRIELRADTRYPVLKVGPVSKVNILYDNIWQNSVAGQQAFWWSYLAATDQHGQPEESPLDWSMGIPRGSTTIGSQSSSATFNVVSIERCGF